MYDASGLTKAGKDEGTQANLKTIIQMKKLVLFLITLISTTAMSELVFDNSFYEPYQTKFQGILRYLYNPSLKLNQPVYAFSDGRKVYYYRQLMTENELYGTHDATKFSYAVIEYPGKGIFYGFIIPSMPEKIESDYKILSGLFEKPDGTVTEMAGQFPSSKQQSAPLGKYSIHTTDGYDSEFGMSTSEGMNEAIINFTFTRGGAVTADYSKSYTAYAQQELANSRTVALKSGGRTVHRRLRSLTGGWYFDVKAHNVQNGKWHVDKGKLFITFGKATSSIAANLNTDRTIQDWKYEHESRFQSPFKMNDYNRQYLEQCREDYPGYQVDKEKECLKEFFATYCSPANMLYTIIYIDENNLIMRNNGYSDEIPSYLNFQKDLSKTPLFSKTDIKAAYNAFKHNASEISHADINARNAVIASQVMQCDLPEIQAATQVYFVNLNKEQTQATVVYIIDLPGDNRIFRANFNLDGTHVNQTSIKESHRELRTLKQTLAKFEENEKKLREAAGNKKNKTAQKQAKDYFKEYKTAPETHFTNIQEFDDVYKNLKARVDIQEEYLK